MTEAMLIVALALAVVGVVVLLAYAKGRDDQYREDAPRLASLSRQLTEAQREREP